LSFEGSQGSCCSDTGWKTVPLHYTVQGHSRSVILVPIEIQKARMRLAINDHINMSIL